MKWHHTNNLIHTENGIVQELEKGREIAVRLAFKLAINALVVHRRHATILLADSLKICCKGCLFGMLAHTHHSNLASEGILIWPTFAN